MAHVVGRPGRHNTFQNYTVLPKKMFIDVTLFQMMRNYVSYYISNVFFSNKLIPKVFNRPNRFLEFYILI